MEDTDQARPDRAPALTTASYAEVSIFKKKLALGVGWIFGILAFVALMALASEIVLIFFAGLLGAIFLNDVSSWIHRHTRLSAGWSLILTIAGLVILSAGAILLLAPSVASQTAELSNRIPQILQDLRQQLERSQWGRSVVDSIYQAEKSYGSSARVVSQAFGFTSTVIGVLGGMLLVAFTAIYLAASPRLYKHGFVKLIPPHHRIKALAVLKDLRHQLGWWMLGRLSSMTLVGTLVSLGLWGLGVPLALSLGFLAAILDFVPNFGPIVAAIPAILLAYTEDPQLAGYVAILYIVVQTLEAYVFYPLILKKAVQLPPLMTIFTQILMGVIAGPLGLILGDAVAVVILVTVRSIYVEGILESPSPRSQTSYAQA